MSASSPDPQPPRVAANLLTAVLFGLAFGFLLQKGGVAKYNVLIGQLLLQDFTVVKVMMSAVAVGMVGVFTLHHFGKVEFRLQPTRLAAQSLGGIVFGIGFALLAYCPGTGAVALGQGSWDVLFGMAGLIAGSYLYAELSGWLGKHLEPKGDLGKLTLPDLVRLPRLPFAIATAVVLVGGLYFLASMFPR